MTNSQVTRFKDSGETIGDFKDDILVACPQCKRCACIQLLAHLQEKRIEPSKMLFQPRRVVCPACGFVREWSGHGLGVDWNSDPMLDGYFGLPLYLQISCCGNTLWAYNRKHLTLIENYIGADLREHAPAFHHGNCYHNNALVNRLPEWMIVAKHRDAVLKAIAHLKTK